MCVEYENYINIVFELNQGFGLEIKDSGTDSGSFYPEMIKLVPQEVFIPRKFCTDSGSFYPEMIKLVPQEGLSRGS